VWGPQTAAASKWFRAHHTTKDSGAANWNVSNDRAKVTPPAKTVDTVPAKKKKTKPPARTDAKDRPQTSPFGKMLDTLLGQIMKPVASGANGAQATTDAQYNPAIAELRRQINQGSRDSNQHQTDIQGWFNGLLSQNAARGKEDASSFQQLLGGSENFMRNLAGAMDDKGASQEVARSAGTSDALLRALMGTSGEFNRNMADAYALTGRDAATKQSRSDAAGLSDMRGKLLDLISSKANALVGNRATAQDTNLKNRAALINQYATMAMLPGQMDQQTLDGMLTSARIDATINPRFKPTAKKPKKPVGYAATSQTDRSKLNTAVYNTLFDDSGNLQFENPYQATHAALNAFRAQGLQPRVDANANRAVKALLQNYLGSSFKPAWISLIKK
jgi:hypothetical protein